LSIILPMALYRRREIVKKWPAVWYSPSRGD
jgi:hypothetical protein